MVTPHPTRQALSSGMSGRIFTHDAWFTTRVGRERAEADHGGDVLPACVMAQRPVHLPPGHEHAADVAQVGVPGGARGALPAGGHEAEDHMVPGRQPRHAGPDLLDDPGALVAADDRKRHRHVARHEVLVGVAHARCRQPDEDLAVLAAGRARSARRSSRRGAPTGRQLRFPFSLPRDDASSRYRAPSPPRRACRPSTAVRRPTRTTGGTVD